MPLHLQTHPSNEEKLLLGEAPAALQAVLAASHLPGEKHAPQAQHRRKPGEKAKPSYQRELAALKHVSLYFESAKLDERLHLFHPAKNPMLADIPANHFVAV